MNNLLIFYYVDIVTNVSRICKVEEENHLLSRYIDIKHYIYTRLSNRYRGFLCVYLTKHQKDNVC